MQTARQTARQIVQTAHEAETSRWRSYQTQWVQQVLQSLSNILPVPDLHMIVLSCVRGPRRFFPLATNPYNSLATSSFVWRTETCLELCAKLPQEQMFTEPHIRTFGDESKWSSGSGFEVVGGYVSVTIYRSDDDGPACNWTRYNAKQYIVRGEVCKKCRCRRPIVTAAGLRSLVPPAPCLIVTTRDNQVHHMSLLCMFRQICFVLTPTHSHSTTINIF